MKGFGTVLLHDVMQGLFVDHPVFELCKLSAVPAACSTDKISGDSLELVNVLATAVRAFLHTHLCIFKATVHTAVAVVVY